jgi:SAM-dependent methyltransferase
MQNIEDENSRYHYFLWYFKTTSSPRIVAHRKYFKQSNRGFGEDAFHAMWEKLLDEFRPMTLLEIGVYRGQTVSLWNILSLARGDSPNIWGVSPLDSRGDSVSEYVDLDYEKDIGESFIYLGLEQPNLFRGMSQDPRTLEFIRGQVWDLIYIDGSHDLPDVQADVALAGETLRPGGILVLDDASLYSSYRPESYSFAGHPGPSAVASVLRAGRDFEEIGTCGHNRVFVKSNPRGSA